MRRRASTNERGESLIELLVAIIIMGTAVVAVVGGLGTAIILSDLNRKQAGVAAHLKIYVANLEGAVAASPTQYVNCATSYPAYTTVEPYKGNVTQVQYWDAPSSSFVASCAAGDTGVQRLHVRVWSNDGRAEQTVDLVIRKPCRPTDAPLCG